MAIATNAPITTIHIMLAVAGTLKASRRPVTIAEPSHTVLGTFSIYFSISHWKSMQLNTEMTLMSNALIPK